MSSTADRRIPLFHIVETGGEAERPDLNAGFFQNAGQVLVSDGEIAIHLRNQGGVESDVPAIHGNAEQKRQDDQHGQQRNGEQSETDGASAHRPVQVLPESDIP